MPGFRISKPLGLLFWCLVFSVANAQVVPLSINAGLSGSWYDSAAPGQGFVVDVVSARNEIFVAWFTYDVATSQQLGAQDGRWFTAQGSYEKLTASLALYQSTGGVLGQPGAADSTQVGSAGLEFSDCNHARFTYGFDSGPSGHIDLERLSPDVLCAALAREPSVSTYFRLSGSAAAFDSDDNTADCALNLIYEVVEVERPAGRVIYLGTLGGEVQRTVLNSAGDGFGFFADVFVPDAQVTWVDPNRIELDGPGSPEEPPGNIFRELGFLDGILDGSGQAFGDWLCGFFSFDPASGYEDHGLMARGTWAITPIEPSRVATLAIRGRSIRIQPISGHKP